MSTSQSASLKEKTCSETTQNSTRSSFALTRPIFKVLQNICNSNHPHHHHHQSKHHSVHLHSGHCLNLKQNLESHSTNFAVLSAALKTLHSQILPDYVWPCELCLWSCQNPAPPAKASSKVYKKPHSQSFKLTLKHK